MNLITSISEASTSGIRSVLLSQFSPIIQGSGLGYPSADVMPHNTMDWMFIFLIGCMVGIGILRYQFNRRFKQSIQTFFQFYSLNQFTREGNFMSERVGFILFSIYLICLSMFTYQANFVLGSGSLFIGSGISLFLKILVGYSIYFLTKTGINQLTGIIFETREASYLIILDDFIIGCINGLMLIPILFFTTYSPSPIIFYIGGAILAFTFFYRLIRASIIGFTYAPFSLLYLFLYLCSLEIVPLVVIIKILAGNSLY